MNWTEGKIGRVLARNTFAGELCVLPNCTWTGHEIDLLVVTKNLRVIDVEIKISRADLKADKDKDKWWNHPSFWAHPKPPATPRAYPLKVWKHYYAMPEEIWRDDLLEHVQPVSGVLLLTPAAHVKCVKRAKPNRDAQKVTETAVVQLARLTSLRMWDAYKEMDRMQDAQRRRGG